MGMGIALTKVGIALIGCGRVMVIYITQAASHSMTRLGGEETLSYIFFNQYS